MIWGIGPLVLRQMEESKQGDSDVKTIVLDPLLLKLIQHHQSCAGSILTNTPTPWFFWSTILIGIRWRKKHTPRCSYTNRNRASGVAADGESKEGDSDFKSIVVDPLLLKLIRPHQRMVPYDSFVFVLECHVLMESMLCLGRLSKAWELVGAYDFRFEKDEGPDKIPMLLRLLRGGSHLLTKSLF